MTGAEGGEGGVGPFDVGDMVLHKFGTGQITDIVEYHYLILDAYVDYIPNCYVVHCWETDAVHEILMKDSSYQNFRRIS